MRQKIRDYFFVGLGAFFIALAMNMFLVPVQLSSGGVGTVGTIFYHLFNIPLSITSLLINAVLFAFGFRLLGKNAIIKTACGIILFSIFLQITASIPIFTSELLLCVGCGGVLCGLGVGLVIRAGGSTGGSDFVGLMLERYLPHIPVAISILVLDLAVILISALVFKSYEVMFYSAIAMLISSRVTDAILKMGEVSRSLLIMSERLDEIERVVLQDFERGATEFHTRGAYSGKSGSSIFCVVSPKEAPLLVKQIRKIDKKAFIVILDARQVLGEGFLDD